MLHVACIARNFDAVLYLTSSRIQKTRDKYGRTADQVCFCPKIKKLLPARYMSSPVKERGRTLKQPTMHEKETMFQLASDSKHFDELQIKLQTLDFDVNHEANSKGDYMVHIAAKEGLSQMPLLMSLVKLQNADIEQTNTKGMSALMIAAETGNPVLADVLMCILGANPNTPNPENGWCALHYAAWNNQVDVINCLLKRGADCNLEDHKGHRPDDLAQTHNSTDPQEIIKVHREQRIDYLSELVEKEELFTSDLKVTDLYNVDRQGRTLIMVAALFNRFENLEVLTEREGCQINAQHQKSGRTALAMAAIEGHTDVIKLLLSKDACPAVKDIEGYLPLHHAVKHKHVDAVEILLENPRALTGLHTALRWSKTSLMQAKIKEAISKRQTEIVIPELFECSITGNAQKLYCVLEDGDNVNPVTGGGDWPMYLAAENGHLDIVKLLFEFGGDVSQQHPTTLNTPLHVACHRGHIDIVKFLLQFTKCFRTSTGYNRSVTSKELDINTQNGDWKTALQFAAEKGYSRIVRLLLNHGATTAILNSDLQLFSCHEFQGVQVLIETHRDQHLKQILQSFKEKKKGLMKLKQIWQAKFDHNLRDRRGDTPLMIICKIGKVDMIRFVLESAVYSLDPQTRHDDRASEISADSGTSDLTINDCHLVSDSSDNETLKVSTRLVSSYRAQSSDSSDDRQLNKSCFVAPQTSPYSQNFVETQKTLTKRTPTGRNGICKSPSGGHSNYKLHIASDRRIHRTSESDSNASTRLNKTVGYDGDQTHDSFDPRESFDTVSCAVGATDRENHSKQFMFMSGTYGTSTPNKLKSPNKKQDKNSSYSQIGNILSKSKSSPADLRPGALSSYPDVPDGWSSSASRSDHVNSPLRSTDRSKKLRSRSELNISRSPVRRRLSWGYGRCNDVDLSMDMEVTSDHQPSHMGSMLSLLEKNTDNPILHGSQICHVCSINPRDGATPLHRAIEGDDNVSIVTLLLEKDMSCVNIQDAMGLTPLHLACRLGRKKIVEKLTGLKYVDLNLRTLDGKLPEEMTTNRSLVNLVKNSRQQQPHRSFLQHYWMQHQNIPPLVERDKSVTLCHPGIRNVIETDSDRKIHINHKYAGKLTVTMENIPDVDKLLKLSLH